MNTTNIELLIKLVAQEAVKALVAASVQPQVKEAGGGVVRKAK